MDVCSSIMQQKKRKKMCVNTLNQKILTKKVQNEKEIEILRKQ